MHEESVDTPIGVARVDRFVAARERGVLVLGHGTATGIEAADLQALAHALPGDGVSVALVTQPYLVARDRRLAASASLDVAWSSVWSHIVRTSDAVPVVAGGRSAGSQVACRTAGPLGAAGVVALAYPILGSGSAAELTAVDLPLLVVQGDRDPFGTPSELPPLGTNADVLRIAGGDHLFRAPTAVASRTAFETLVAGTGRWLHRTLVGRDG